jgi:hypothetical protein
MSINVDALDQLAEFVVGNSHAVSAAQGGKPEP